MTMLPFGQIAPINRRAVAYIIDALIAGGLAIVLGVVLVVAATLSGGIEAMVSVLLIGGPIVGVILLGWFVFYTIMQSGAGSIGMRAQGLRLADETSGAGLGFGRTLVRNIIFGLAGGIVVGYFTPLFDGTGRFQGWHDKVAKSVMLDARTSPAAPAPAAKAAKAAQPVAPVGYPAAPAAPAAPAIPGIPHPSSQPGLATPSYPASVSAPPVAPAQPYAPVAPAEQYAPAAPAQQWAAAPAPAAPAQPYTPAEPAAPVQPSVPAAPDADDDSLIAFVPGVTQDAPPPRATPAPQPAADLDATVRPEDVSSYVAPAAPVSPFAAPAAPASPFAAPVVPPSIVPAPVVAPAPVIPPLPTASAAESPLHDSDDVENTRISIPGHRLVFTWDDGTRVSISRRTIFGRNPAPEDGAVIVPVRDETLSLSKTHFEAAAETSGGWVLDRHSTNGMTIVREGLRIACPPGQRVPIRLGDALEIGDRIVTIGGYA